MRIKICGLTRAEDAVLAQRLGAWALGFIFAEQSKRHVTAMQAGEIISSLPRLEKKTHVAGVFVNQTTEALNIAKRIPLSILQLHGDETPQECLCVKDSFDGWVIKALRPTSEKDLDDIHIYQDVVDYILIDTPSTGEYGGTGKTADWTLAAKASSYGVPVILAGGLHAGNIQDAARIVRPFALDLSSSVEQSPGVKDAVKMEALFMTARLIPSSSRYAQSSNTA